MMQLPNLLLWFPLIFSLFFIILFKVLKPQSKLDLPPGPWQLPIIGSLHHISLNALTHRTFHNLAMKYGPLFHLKLGQVNFIVASSSATACEILKTHDQTFASRPVMLAVKTIAYDSVGVVFSPYGPYWRQLRKICMLELLGSKKVKSFSSIRGEEAEKLVEKIRRAGGFKVNMTEMFWGAVIGHVTSSVVGNKYGNMGRFVAALKELMKLLPLLRPADMFPTLGFILSVVDGSKAKMEKVRKEMDEILNEIVAEHLGKKELGEGESEDDFVTSLLRLKEKDELPIPLGFDNVKALILDMLVGASESTSAILEWAMTELIRHPEVMRKAQKEIREINKGKQKLEESDIDQLEYLKMVIKETLRMHPPIPLLVPRICTEETKLYGYTIPANSWVAINVWAIGRDPKVWENPESFCPERFNGSSTDYKGTNYEYIPFGSGRRICPGMSFAIAEIEHYLALLLLNFDWEVPDGRGPDSIDTAEGFGGTVRRKNDLYLLATPHPIFQN